MANEGLRLNAADDLAINDLNIESTGEFELTAALSGKTILDNEGNQESEEE